MRTLLLALSLSVLALGCGGGDDSGSSTSGSEEPVDPDLPAEEETNACPPGGSPPVEGEDGIPTDCEVLFDGCCFTDPNLACQAAGCDPGCPVMESYPGQISPCVDE